MDVEKEIVTQIEETEIEETEENNGAEELSAAGEVEAHIEGDLPHVIPELPELPEFSEALQQAVLQDDPELVAQAENSELGDFESANIEEIEFIEDEIVSSIIESVLFSSDRPVSLASLKFIFKGTNVKTDRIRRALDRLSTELAGAQRGVTLDEVPGGFQLRTKLDNLKFISRNLKAKPFKLSGPALEVLSIVAYKQPVVKSEIDSIRGVESGHLLRALMEKNLVNFGGKSDLPGKPMQYETTKKFLEIFSLRNLKELPSLSQIDELLPDGIVEEEGNAKQTKLSDLTDSLSQEINTSYSQGEEELNKISSELEDITSTSDFFEQEKRRQREKRDTERAQGIREAIMVGEGVSTRDRNWLAKYDEALMMGKTLVEIEMESEKAKLAQLKTHQSNESVVEQVEDSIPVEVADSEELGEDDELTGPIADIEEDDERK